SCEFGFIKSTTLTREILEQVIKEKLNDLLITAGDINDPERREQRQTVLRSLFDMYELPLILRSVRENSTAMRIYSRAEWADLENDHALLTLFALQKIKFLSGKICAKWR